MHEIDSIAKGNSLAFVLQAAKSFTPAPAPPTGRGQVSRPLRLRTAQLANRIEMSGGLNLSGTG